MVQTIHAGSIGTAFRMPLLGGDGDPLPLGGATLQMIFTQPDETRVVKTASIYLDPDDGIAEYISIAADFDDVGSWRWQTHVTQGSDEWWSDVADFEVLPNL